MRKPEGKVALVTGSTQGIGEGIAMRLASEGAKIIVNGRSIERGNSVVKTLKSRGAEAMFIPADPSEKNQAEELVLRGTVDEL